MIVLFLFFLKAVHHYLLPFEYAFLTFCVCIYACVMVLYFVLSIKLLERKRNNKETNIKRIHSCF